MPVAAIDARFCASQEAGPGADPKRAQLETATARAWEPSFILQVKRTHDGHFDRACTVGAVEKVVFKQADHTALARIRMPNHVRDGKVHVADEKGNHVFSIGFDGIESREKLWAINSKGEDLFQVVQLPLEPVAPNKKRSPRYTKRLHVATQALKTVDGEPIAMEVSAGVFWLGGVEGGVPVARLIRRPAKTSSNGYSADFVEIAAGVDSALVLGMLMAMDVFHLELADAMKDLVFCLGLILCCPVY